MCYIMLKRCVRYCVARQYRYNFRSNETPNRTKFSFAIESSNCCTKMTTDSTESMKFVLLIEEHKDVLLISQAAEFKKKKTEAVGKIIPKWTEISGKTLTQASLFKKINNFKSRAKSVSNSGKTLSDWQIKLLEIVVNFDRNLLKLCTKNNNLREPTLELMMV